MKIIISPTKQMTTEPSLFSPTSRPQFLDDTKILLDKLKHLTLKEAKEVWKCNDKLLYQNYERLQTASLTEKLNPAIMSYKGIQYQYMAPDLLTEPALIYLQEHIRILSGFYGVLRPFDGIIPYRLEMQAPLSVLNYPNLYKFWGKKLYESLFCEGEPVLNLASKEYTKVLTPYLKPTDQFIDVHFYHLVDNKLKVKATLAKMARGEMVRYLAENQIKSIEKVAQFTHPHYVFSKKESSANRLVFIYH